MSDEAAPEKTENPGAPSWMVTFADLMTLLMCFFVLLVAFSELDIQRYRMIAGSMKMAFGVQREFRGIDIPKGTALLAAAPSPGQPSKAPNNKEEQKVVDEAQQTLENKAAEAEANDEEISSNVERIVEVMAEEVESGIVHVEGLDDRIIIRIDERGMFTAGSHKLQPQFKKLLQQLGLLLEEMDGTISVGGHTDDKPIRNGTHRSNWDLSAKRAVSVVHQFLESTEIPVYRLIAQGHAHSRPLVPNDTQAHRALNRRVEISVTQTSGDSNPF
jgi:chemotaxis protein MotB